MILLLIIPLLVLQIQACSAPVFGHFGSYQAMNGMFAEMFGSNGWISFFIPRSFTLVNGQPELHLLYVPFGAWFARLLQILLRLPTDSLIVLGKLFSLSAMLGAAGFLRAVLMRQGEDKSVANLSAFLFLTAPVVAVMGVSFQNEAWALFFLMISTYALVRARASTNVAWSLLAGVCFGFAVSARIHFGFFAAPAFILLMQSRSRRFLNGILFYSGFAAVVVLWIYGYRWLDAHYGSMTSLFSQAGEGRVGQWHWLKQKVFYWRLFKEVFVYWGMPFLPFLLILSREHHKKWFWYLWLAAAVSVVVLLPKKVFDHPFYLIGAIPAFSVVCAHAIYEKKIFLKKSWRACLGILILLYCAALFLRSQILPSKAPIWIQQSHAIRTVIPQEGKVILQHEQNAAMHYYIHRFGWGFDLEMEKSDILQSHEPRHLAWLANGYGNLQKWFKYLVSQGGEWFIITDIARFNERRDFADFISRNYKIYPQDRSDLLIYDLRNAS